MHRSRGDDGLVRCRRSRAENVLVSNVAELYSAVNYPANTGMIADADFPGNEVNTGPLAERTGHLSPKNPVLPQQICDITAVEY